MIGARPTMEAGLIFDDQMGLRAAYDCHHMNGEQAVQRYGPLIYKLMLDAAPNFTKDQIYRGMGAARFKQISSRVAKAYIGYVIAYINASALPHEIKLHTYHNLGRTKFYWSITGCNNS
jgi:hypothetical protein